MLLSARVDGEAGQWDGGLDGLHMGLDLWLNVDLRLDLLLDLMLNLWLHHLLETGRSGHLLEGQRWQIAIGTGTSIDHGQAEGSQNDKGKGFLGGRRKSYHHISLG